MNHDAPPMAVRREWWRDSVIYQIYLKSYADSDGDGIGDLRGVASRLGHIASLGVDGIWLNPCYPSPNRDGGYDVADYFAIDERFGGMAAFEELRQACADAGLKLLMDLVPNHCSDQHEWFRQALAAGPGSQERARFHFADGRGPDGSQPPNNWQSTFGGPAWTRVPDGQWYLHSFDTSQPDFNWENPEVAGMFDDVLRFWFDRGIDGFRIDVAYAMVKHTGLPDLDDPDGENPYAWNQPGVHDIFRRWRAIADSYPRELTLVGEVWLPPADAADYVRPGELKQVFFFDLLQQGFEASAFRLSITESVDALKHAEGVAAWTLNSHDVHRAVTRYGLVDPEPMVTVDLNALRTRARGRVDLELGQQRAAAAAMLMMALPGTAYLYQGEELGLPEVQDLDGDRRQDPIWARSGHTEHGRDGCRVPLPWSAGEVNFGFSTGVPWLPQPEWFAAYAVDAQDGFDGYDGYDGSNSMLALYRQALRLRRTIDPDAPLTWRDAGRDDVLMFDRGSLTCVTVFGGDSFSVPVALGELVLSSRRGHDGALPANSTGWFRRRGA